MQFEMQKAQSKTNRDALFSSVGAPTALSYGINIIIRVIADVIYKNKTEFIQCMYLNEFTDKFRSINKSTAKTIVFFSDCPQMELLDLFIRVRASLVISQDNFFDLVAYLMRSRGMSLVRAIRFGTQVACAVGIANGAANIIRISAADHARQLTSIVNELIHFFGVHCDFEQFSEILARLAPGKNSHSLSLSEFLSAQFPDFQLESARPGTATSSEDLVARIAADYDPLLRGQDFKGGEWPVELFLKWDVEGAFLDGPIELVGPARFIICGPYLHLPKGAWRMSVQIDVEECFSDNRLGVDIFSGTILTAATMKLPVAGRFGFALDFEVQDPMLPVELRVQLSTGAIEGRLSLVAVRLTRPENPAQPDGHLQ